MSYYNENFLLKNEYARILYHNYAKEMPIFDYHCHLPEKQILENERFYDIVDIWLAGDHYKWRLMRNFGIDERYITGDATKKEKFLAYCKTLGSAFGNPLYHWSQVELEEFFGCNLEISEENAEEIYRICNAYLQEHVVTPASLIEQSNVAYIFTTNEIFDDLTTFEKIKAKGYPFEVLPAFRADKIMNVEAALYTEYIAKLEALTHAITDMDTLEDAIRIRLADFIAVGCRASDIAVEYVTPVSAREDAEAVLKKALRKEAISLQESDVFKGYFTYFLMKLYGVNHIRTELHFGAMRNNNSKMFRVLGLDSGYDCVSEHGSLTNISRLFDRLNEENALPATILFNLNGKQNLEIMPLLGCFQSSEVRGKMQYGPAWWFLDNKVGMEKHLEDLTATGHLATFVGMLTDSRSLLSYPRHHYFRRILCNYLGTMMTEGEMTTDVEKVGQVVRDISFLNSESYFRMK
ncbi:MAG: glucuronate isomerase [Clostridia bacterium]|nr:glucuronate isomerase [Clostridia bacterium]